MAIYLNLCGEKKRNATLPDLTLRISNLLVCVTEANTRSAPRGRSLCDE
jgi:hypothetical protein